MSAPVHPEGTHLVPGCLNRDLLAGRRSAPGGTIWEDDFWLLPRPRDQRPGLHLVLFHLDLRIWLTRLGFRRWLVPDEEVADLAARLRQSLDASPPPRWQAVDGLDAA